MKYNIPKILATVVLLLTFLGIGYFFNKNQEPLLSLKNLSISSFLILLILQVLLLLTNGLFLKEFVAKFNIKLEVTEWLGLAIVTTMGNYLTPLSGGLLFRATYLKHQHSFSFTKFATFLSANYLINFWVIGVMGVLTIILINPVETNRLVLLFFLLVVFIISAIFLLPFSKMPGHSRFIKIINTSIDGWLYIKQDRNLLIRLIFYTLINILLNASSFWIASNALGFTISAFSSVMISLIAAFSIVIKLTPANLGIHEAIIGFTSPLVGIGVGEGLMTALVLRGAGMIILFFLGPIFSYILAKKLSNFYKDKNIKPINLSSKKSI